jgi:hypothetical protein
MTKDQEIKQLHAFAKNCEIDVHRAIANMNQSDRLASDIRRLIDGEVYVVELGKPPAPDCRTCRQFYWSQFTGDYRCHFTKEGGVCTNGDQYQPEPKLVLWRTE